MKIDALNFSFAGDKYLGRSYEEMDCQAFVEKCMADCGLRMDLGGSNSWYREIMKNGWTGTPEECVSRFRVVPKGAILFIWEPVSEGTPEQFKYDGIGDLTHMGIKTGRNDGAIHSSHSKGGVVRSVFKDKTIKNGGWNRVGLYNRFDYGKAVNDNLANGPSNNTNEEVSKPVSDTNKAEYIILAGGNGTTPINIRSRQSTSSPLVDQCPQGGEVQFLQDLGDWVKIKYHGKTGYVKAEFVRIKDEEPVTDDSHIPAEDPDEMTEDSPKINLTLSLMEDEAVALFNAVTEIRNQLINMVGKG